MLSALWLIPLLPLAGFAVNGLLGARTLPRRAVGPIACAAVLGSFVISAGAVMDLANLSRAGSAARFTQDLFTWIPMGSGPGGADLTVRWAYALDPLAAVMLLVVTGIGFLIHLYSLGYMHDEPRPAYARFFAYLNLFMAMMLTLVLGATLPVLFVGWEGVGLCSYLLIGFYYDRPFDETTGMTCADAGRKAFITNRVGDLGVMLAMLLLFTTAGTLDIQGILARVGIMGPAVCGAAALLLFFGVCGKSAQIPLYVWLPDAMAGPTPVSALIHAATMVTAGVYLVCRMGPLFLASPEAMAVVAVVGALTALLAAIIGTAQNDIKKVLAYSTVSQLGYMVLATGVGAFTPAIFHLMTHAFFKALLFLGAGSVIHALSGEQQITRMGGLRRHLPVTHATFLIGVLAIAGVPPLAGFFSKDGILWATLAGGPPGGGGLLLWLIGVLTSGLTAFYMTRLYLLVFAGAPRLSETARHHLHESPPIMTLPLVVLAAGACLAGFLGVPHFLGGGLIPDSMESWLAPVLGGAPVSGSAPLRDGAPLLNGAAGAAEPMLSEWAATLVALGASLAGIAVAATLYARGPRPEPASPSPWLRLVRGKFFADELIDAAILSPYRALCRAAARFDEAIVDGLVNAVGAVTDVGSQIVRLTQTGLVRNYALVFLLGTVVILFYALR